jgi:hypothetical protein
MSQFFSRYEALGIPYPDPATVCSGQCEGVGFYPQHRIDPDATAAEREAWNRAHAKSCSLIGRVQSLYHAIVKRDRIYLKVAFAPCDDWHFIKCPDCGGTGKRN